MKTEFSVCVKKIFHEKSYKRVSFIRVVFPVSKVSIIPRYKAGKQTKELTKEEFWKVMEKGRFIKRMHRAFLVLLYYIGCRKIEALRLRKERFKVKGDILFCDIPAVKGGIERNPFQLALSLPYIDELCACIEKTRKGKRVFPFTEFTAWLIVKRVLPKHYPHFFRLNRTVKFLNNPNITTNEIRQWMAWKRLATVESYVGYSERTIGKLSKELE